MNKFRKFMPPILAILLIIIVWQILSDYFLSSSVLPSPAKIAQAAVNFYSDLLLNSAYTVFEAAVGIIFAVGFGFISSLVLFFAPNLRKAVYPLLVASHIVPIIAIAPLLLIWFVFGVVPKILVVIIYSFFPITVGLIDGYFDIPKEFIDYGKSLKLTKLQLFRNINLPAAMPRFFSGLKVASLYAVPGAVVGEFVGAYKGLGIMLLTSLNSRVISLVFAVSFFIIFLSLILINVVELIESQVLVWRKYETSE